MKKISSVCAAILKQYWHTTDIHTNTQTQAHS